MIYIGVGLWVYMAIGAIMGLLVIRDPEFTDDVEELAGEFKEVFHKKIAVVLMFALIGAPVGLYSLLKRD